LPRILRYSRRLPPSGEGRHRGTERVRTLRRHCRKSRASLRFARLRLLGTPFFASQTAPDRIADRARRFDGTTTIGSARALARSCGLPRPAPVITQTDHAHHPDRSRTSPSCVTTTPLTAHACSVDQRSGFR